ncbi:MAG: glycosyltransferase [Candidatus Helarchaeota archaeon]
MATKLDVQSSENIKLNYRKIITVPLCFLILSLIFFLFSYLYFPLVFNVFILINLGIQIINLFFMILQGYIPFLMKPKTYPKPHEWPEVTIIIPVFNDGNILKETMEHLLKLRYPKIKMIIVYSEKSTDNTYEIATGYAKTYPFISVISENISAANAKNVGVQTAQTKYVLILDSDTYVKDGFLETGIPALEADNNLVLVQACNIGLNAGQNTITSVLFSLNAITTFFLKGSNKVFENPCYRGFGALWRRQAIIEAGLFSLEALVDDYEFNFRLIVNYPDWKALFLNEHNVFEYYPTTVKDFYYQQLRWFRGAMNVYIKYFFQLGRTKLKYKVVVTLHFLSGVVFPIIGIFSIGMYIIQFFLSFVLQRSFIFSTGNFLFYFGFIALILTFIGYGLFAFSAYSKVTSKKRILLGLIIILFFLSIIIGIVVVNAVWLNIRKEKKLYVKVAKDELQLKKL